MRLVTTALLIFRTSYIRTFAGIYVICQFQIRSFVSCKYLCGLHLNLFQYFLQIVWCSLCLHCIFQAKIPGCYWNSWLRYITRPFHIWGECSTLPLLLLFGVISVAEMMLKLIYNLFLSICAFRVGHWDCGICFLFSGFVAKEYKFCTFEASKLPFSATCIDMKFYF